MTPFGGDTGKRIPSTDDQPGSLPRREVRQGCPELRDVFSQDRILPGQSQNLSIRYVKIAAANLVRGDGEMPRPPFAVLDPKRGLYRQGLVESSNQLRSGIDFFGYQ